MCRTDAATAKLSEQRALADLFQESGAECVGGLEHGANDTPGQQLQFILIGVYRRSVAAMLYVRFEPILLKTK